MNPIDLGVIFTLGLVSSLHCVQMSGPIVLSYSVAVESLNKRNDHPILPALLGNHVAYNTGRILTYSAMGAIVGTAGVSKSYSSVISPHRVVTPTWEWRTPKFTPIK